MTQIVPTIFTTLLSAQYVRRTIRIMAAIEDVLILVWLTIPTIRTEPLHTHPISSVSKSIAASDSFIKLNMHYKHDKEMGNF